MNSVKCLVLSLILFFSMIPMRVFAYSSPGNPTGYINDFAGIVSAETKTNLENKIASLDASTSAQIAIVTINTLDGDSIENYALKLFEEWKIGKKGVDNGVLLLVAKEDRKVRIEVGYGLEGSLTDAETSLIIRKIITPAFKEGNYDKGISQGALAILEAIEKDEVSAISTSTFQANETFELVMNGLMFGIPLLLWFISVLSRSKSWWAGGLIGGIIGLIFFQGLGLLLLGLIGLFIDYVVSKEYKKSVASNSYPWWIGGKSGFGGGKSSSSGGFGGFGGGRSGGGGSSGSW